MALLEAMMFQQQQQQDLFGYGSTSKDLYALLATCYEDHQEDHFYKYLRQQQLSKYSGSVSGGGCCGDLYANASYWDSPEKYMTCDAAVEQQAPAPTTNPGRRKRRRTKTLKNKEELENQRMTHITVERNRRKQMNQYLDVLRSMMPPSYVQRGDQASIVGGAINFVKEMEHLLQTLEAQKQINSKKQHQNNNSNKSDLFSDFFVFPQYSTRSDGDESPEGSCVSLAAAADVEVTLVEGHANLKVMSRRQPKQVVKMVAGLYSLRLSVLHLNVSTTHHHVLYSFIVKVEDDCELTSVTEIAAAVHEMVSRIQEEQRFSVE